MSEDLVTVAQVNKPTITFYEDGDYIVLKTETCTHTGEIWFRFGEEYFEKTRDGRNCQVKHLKYIGSQERIIRDILGICCDKEFQLITNNYLLFS